MDETVTEMGGLMPSSLLEVEITRMAVRSSNVEGIGYNGEWRVLEVAFRGKEGAPASVYRYAGVPAEVAAELREVATGGGSVGGYLAQHIKPQYACTKMEPAVEEVLS